MDSIPEDGTDSISEDGVTNGVDNEDIHLTNLQTDDVLGMTFETWEEAFRFYNSYASVMGFSLRTHDGKKRKRADGDFVMKEWTCNRKGKRRVGNVDEDYRVRKHIYETRCDCKARLRIILTNGSTTTQWVVTRFVALHNHDITERQHVRYLRSHRKINESDMAQILSLRESGIKPAQIMEFMIKQAGGRANLGFEARDLYNVLYAYSMQQIVDGDAMHAIGFLDSKKTYDNCCFHEYTATEDGRLGNLFWCDTMCRYDYSCFSNVLTFDATYMTNKYKRPLVMLLGVNHNFRTCFFGCAILQDETKETYIWLLRTFLKAMDNRQPNSVITDNCQAMAAAITSEMPNARHRLCEWHLDRNCVQNLSNPTFTKEFKKFRRMSDRERFDTEWNDLLRTHGLENNMWVREYLCRQRELWSDAFLLGQFFAEQHTTERCESINSHQHRFMGKRLKLHKLVEEFDAEFERLREGESHADFKSRYGNPISRGPLGPLDAHAANVFTRAIYIKIKHQMDMSYALNNVCVNDVQNFRMYTIARYIRQDATRTVVYNADDHTYKCSCKHFESYGYPCRHIILVLKIRNVENFPDELILKRWTKVAKDDINISGANSIPPEMQVTIRCGAISTLCNRIARLSSQTLERFNKVRLGMTNMYGIV